MFSNHLFWMVAILFLCSAVNLNVLKEYRHSIRVLPYIIGIVGVFGMFGGLVTIIDLSIRFQWWWFFAFAVVGLFLIGIFSYLTRNKISVYLGTINILFIPFIWWYGSRLNTTLTCDWFYNIVGGIQNFFG